MCGIFGFVISRESQLTKVDISDTIKYLFNVSESRGKEASGLAIQDAENLYVLKEPISASTLIPSKTYTDLLGQIQCAPGTNRVFMGHARLVTNGSFKDNHNNQPVILNDMAIIHNGIIVNESDLWSCSKLKKQSSVDTEVILARVHEHLHETKDAHKALEKTFSEIKGTASIASFIPGESYLFLGTNTGSLYTTSCSHGTIFASEKIFIEKFIESRGKQLGFSEISQIPPTTVTRVSLENGRVVQSHEQDRFSKKNLYTVRDISTYGEKQIMDVKVHFYPQLEKVFQAHADTVAKLKRCTNCILPETMPFISFDTQGICNYCRNHIPRTRKGNSFKLPSDFKASQDPNIVVSLSGGRDSCYALHLAKKEYGLKPIAISYDWGMITDLGRRNQARLCGSLGVEHILISADIAKKRENIRKNVTAWLQKPELGIIPLFMAGDKHYFYFLNTFMRESNLAYTLYAENYLEKTDFKTGFCNIPPEFLTEGTAYNISLLKKFYLILYYAKQYIKNPSYINATIPDTLSAFFASYFIPHAYLYIFDSIAWDETTIIQTLEENYDWERSPDTISTWRIGDGTAPFYNYIYYMLAGFTENDTFRSNQIREGILTREKALALVIEENKPRWESLAWYFDAIHIDMESALSRINTESLR